MPKESSYLPDVVSACPVPKAYPWAVPQVWRRNTQGNLLQFEPELKQVKKRRGYRFLLQKPQASSGNASIILCLASYHQSKPRLSMKTGELTMKRKSCKTNDQFKSQ